MAVPEVQVFIGEGTLKVGMEAAREDRWKRSRCQPYNCLLGGASTLTMSSSSQTCSLLAHFFHMQELLIQKSHFIFLPCELKSPCLAIGGDSFTFLGTTQPITAISGQMLKWCNMAKSDFIIQRDLVTGHLCPFPDNVCQFQSVLKVTSRVPHVSQGHVPGLWQGWGEMLGSGYFGHCLPLTFNLSSILLLLFNPSSMT